MLETIRNPVFLRKSCGTVNNKFLGVVIICHRCLHLDSIVAETQFGQAEASYYFEAVDFIEQVRVSVCVQGHDRAAKEVVLHSELNGSATVNLAKEFVCQENIFWIFEEVLDRNDATLCHLPEPLHGKLTRLIPIGVVFWNEYRILEKLVPPVYLLKVISKNHLSDFVLVHLFVKFS